MLNIINSLSTLDSPPHLNFTTSDLTHTKTSSHRPRLYSVQSSVHLNSLTHTDTHQWECHTKISPWVGQELTRGAGPNGAREKICYQHIVSRQAQTKNHVPLFPDSVYSTLPCPSWIGEQSLHRVMGILGLKCLHLHVPVDVTASISQPIRPSWQWRGLGAVGGSAGTGGDCSWKHLPGSSKVKERLVDSNSISEYVDYNIKFVCIIYTLIILLH